MLFRICSDPGKDAQQTTGKCLEFRRDVKYWFGDIRNNQNAKRRNRIMPRLVNPERRNFQRIVRCH